ncbi:MAG: amidohydrolase family protein [Gemmatimonadetes bacterium]|nr:amidohydrolase family protein [Gemmatimonadota bacterium]
MTTPLAGTAPLIDVHAHFGRSFDTDRRRLEAGDRIGISCHVASILGTWGTASPTYFASPDDVTGGNTSMYHIADHDPGRIRAYIHVNPNYPAHALAELERGIARGGIGVKLAAARRCDDPLLDPVCEFAAAHHLPVLHHLWQHRTRHWPGQDISDAADLARLAARHPTVSFIAAHISGGGDWQHSLPAAAGAPNVCFDLSGSGCDRGMLDDGLQWLGPRRLLWAADVTLCTGLAKLRALDVIGLPPGDLADIRWRNAVRIFPPGAFAATAAIAREGA